MAYEINIVGEVIPFNYWGMSGYVNLSDVENELKNAKGQDLLVNINSYGGDVDEGFMIYTALRKYAKDNDASITTYAKGRCASIATVIFLAGDERVLNKYVEPFVHNAWTYAEGDAKEILRVAADLQRVNNKIAEFYADHTDLTIEQATALMDAESFISVDECVNIRFGTKIDEILRPVALNKIFNKNKNNMAIKNEKEFFNKLCKLFGNTKNLVLHTSTNGDLEFPDVAEGDEPKIGDSATIEGKPAEGEITLADGTVFTFEDGKLTNIEKEAEEGGEEESVTVENLQKENESLKAQIEAQNKRLQRIENSNKENASILASLKNLVSENVIDDKDNSDKGTNPDKGKETIKKGLAGAIGNLNKKK